MKNKLLALCLSMFLSCFTFVSIFAQNRGAVEVGSNMGQLQNMLYLKNIISEGITEAPLPENLDGSVYLSEEFTNSEVVIKEEQALVKGFSLRYNIMNDAMEFVKDNETRALHKNKIVQINVGGDLFIVTTMQEEGKEILKYMKTLSFEKPYALKSYEIAIQEPFYHPGMHSSCPNPKAVTQAKLFVKLPNEQVVVEIDKKATLYKLVGEKQKQVKTYMKKNQLGVKKQEDLQKIIEYYISLS